MININDFLVNILIQQITIIVSEQSANKVDLERIDNALIGANNAIILIHSMNDAGLASVEQETINTLMSKFQLNNLIKNSDE